jgi:predicted Zn-dependent protease with MMP-like domain
MSAVSARRASCGALKAPSLAEIEELAYSAFAALPGEFRRFCEGLIIRVEDFPDRETLAALDCESEFDILGLFRGRGRAQSPAIPLTGQLPNMIWLYRRPILDYWAEHDETLAAIVTHVLVHEIGHHFGLSDEDMRLVEGAAG